MIRINFLVLISILCFSLPVTAAYCPSPEAIKPRCKTLVNEDMVQATIMEELKEYNLKKLDKQVIKKITKVINANPEHFTGILPIRVSDKDPIDQFVEIIGNLLNMSVSNLHNDRKVTSMLVRLMHKAKGNCQYTNTQLNLIGARAIKLHANKIKNFEIAYFSTKDNETNPSLRGIITDCVYRLSNGKTFDLVVNDQGILPKYKPYEPKFKLNENDRKHWNKDDFFDFSHSCKGHTVADCPFSLES